MATITAPNIEVTQVVTGYIYELSLAEEDSGSGITRIDIGPYRFEGVMPRIKYPEAVTNEMAPPDWQPIRWFTDASGNSWLRYQGGIIRAGDGEALFQFTSNFASSGNAGQSLVVWRGDRSETYGVRVPDYSQQPTLRNSRRDSSGLGKVYQTGCAPHFVLGCVLAVGIVILHIA